MPQEKVGYTILLLLHYSNVTSTDVIFRMSESDVFLYFFDRYLLLLNCLLSHTLIMLADSKAEMKLAGKLSLTDGFQTQAHYFFLN